jgi:AbrB family looped-hinge helix DNA binding protein
MTVTMDKAGRIVIPLKVRQKLHLKPGVSFDIATTPSGIQLEPKRPEGRIVYKNGIPTLTFDCPVDFDVVAEINRDRENRADYISGVGGYDRDDLL